MYILKELEDKPIIFNYQGTLQMTLAATLMSHVMAESLKME